MKVIIATGIFSPEIGGPATYVAKLAPFIKEIPEVEVEVVTFADTLEDTKSFPYLVHRILRGKSVIGRYMRYAKKIKEVTNDGDVLYIQGPMSAGIPALWGARGLKLSRVLKVVGDPAWEMTRNAGCIIPIDCFQKTFCGIKPWILKIVRTYIAKRMNVIITPSKYLSDLVIGWGVKGDVMRVVYNAAPKVIGSTNSRDKGLIMTAGRLVNWKGYDRLIKAVSRIPEARLVILGKGEEMNRLEKLIVELGLNDRVFMAGSVPKEKVMDYFARAEAFVLNTEYEGYSHVLLEAMAAGAPVITTGNTGNVELVEHDKNGLLVEFGEDEGLEEAIKKVLGDSELRERLSKEGKLFCNSLPSSDMLLETRKILIGK